MVNLPCCVLLVLLVQRQIEVFSGLIWVGMELKRQLKFCAVVCVTLLPVIGESWEAGWLKPDRRKCSLQKINKTADMQETQENCRNKESRNSNKYRKIHPKEKKKGKPAKPKKKLQICKNWIHIGPFINSSQALRQLLLFGERLKH